MIGHKHEDLTGPQFGKVHPHLREILSIASYLAFVWYRDDLIITAIFDPQHPGLTHRAAEPFYRFVDCSVLHHGGLAGSERLRATINAGYAYDPERKPNLLTVPPLVHESTLDHTMRPPHFHFQIAPRWLSVPPGPTPDWIV